MKYMKSAVLILSGLLFFGCINQDSISNDVIDTNNDRTTVIERDRTPLLLISIDGFRPDYFDRTDTPNFDRVISSGVKAEYLQSIYPSNTFPNHYSLATGLYAENTGIIANNMFDEELGRFGLRIRDAVSDGRWYGGEPIWVTAEKQDVRTATMFWPGSEADVMGIRPTRWMQYDGRIPYETRVDSIITWLSVEDDTRPDFMTLYFSTVDSQGHSHGVESDEVTEAIELVDSKIGYLLDELKRIGLYGNINILFTSDHGMASLSEEKTIIIDDIIDLDDVYVRNWSSAGMIEPKEGKLDKVYNQLKQAEDAYDNVFRVYLKEDIPERFRFKNHPRVPEILIEFDVPWTMTSRSNFESRGILAATHGWDPEMPEMHTVFFAYGPDFKNGEEISKVKMVDIYELMCHLLGLEPAENDGSFEIWNQALK